MYRYLCKITKGLAGLLIVLIVAGCAPGPPPPMPPGLFSSLIGWIVIGLLVWGAVLLWKNLNSAKTANIGHLTDALNAINDRLTALEKKMNQSEKTRNKEDVMKNIFMIFTVVTVSMLLGLAPYSKAEQNTAPPLLVQQLGAQPPVSGAPPVPPGPGTPPVPPLAPPPPVPGIGQSIPVQRLLNNLSTAVATVKKTGNQLIPGKVWTMRGPSGEIELKAGILYRGSVVAVLYFNPLDGSVLPLGMPIRGYQNTSQVQSVIQRVKAQLPAIISQLKILPAAEFREPEASWAFPLALGSSIAAHLKIYYDGVYIVPDYPANQEMTYYGQ